MVDAATKHLIILPQKYINSKNCCKIKFIGTVIIPRDTEIVDVNNSTMVKGSGNQERVVIILDPLVRYMSIKLYVKSQKKIRNLQLIY